MKYLSEVLIGDLIIIRTNIQTMPPCPVLAKSVRPQEGGLSVSVLIVLATIAFAEWLITKAPGQVLSIFTAIAERIEVFTVSVVVSLTLTKINGLVVA